MPTTDSGRGFLVIDAGSSSLRIAVTDPLGKALRVATCPWRASAEVDLDALMAELFRLAGQVDAGATPLGGIAVSAQLGVALLDADLRPVGPVTTWADTTGAGPDGAVDRLGRELGEAALRLAGRRVTAGSAAVRLQWLRSTMPDAAPSLRWITSIKDAIVARLTGQVVTDPTHASYSMLYDTAAGCWSDELTGTVGVDHELLAPVRPASAHLPLSDDAARALGLPSGLPVCIGGPDGTVGAVGAGATAAGRTIDISGTTDVLVHVTSAPVSDPTGRCVRNQHLVPGLWTIGGATGTTGGMLDLLIRLLGTGAEDLLAEGRLVTVPIGSRGLVVDTALGGHRFPNWGAPGGSIAGFDAHHHREDLIAAALEGTARLVLEGILAVEDAGCPVGEVVVTGGGASEESLRRRAALWGRPVVAPTLRESTLRGAALIAMVATGTAEDIDAAHRLVTSEERPVRVEAPAGDLRAAERAFTSWGIAPQAPGSWNLPHDPTEKDIA